MACLFVGRTARQDQTLQHELYGYTDYTSALNAWHPGLQLDGLLPRFPFTRSRPEKATHRDLGLGNSLRYGVACLGQLNCREVQENHLIMELRDQKRDNSCRRVRTLDEPYGNGCTLSRPNVIAHVD